MSEYIKLEDILKHKPCKRGRELAIRLFAGRQRVKLTPELLNMPEVRRHFLWLVVKGIINLSHAQVVIASGDSKCNYLFAGYIQGADIKAHAQAVLEDKKSAYGLDWAKCVLRSIKQGGNSNMKSKSDYLKSILFFIIVIFIGIVLEDFTWSGM